MIYESLMFDQGKNFQLISLSILITCLLNSVDIKERSYMFITSGTLRVKNNSHDIKFMRECTSKKTVWSTDNQINVTCLLNSVDIKERSYMFITSGTLRVKNNSHDIKFMRECTSKKTVWSTDNQINGVKGLKVWSCGRVQLYFVP